MKASLKFREDKKPLLRAKIPITVLGLPFLSAFSAGDTSDLRLDLSTAFPSGPALRLSYRPNDSWNPFSIVLKTGTGPFGNPSSAPLSMSAEFSLLGRGTTPAFFVHFQPQFGDFRVRKIATSAAPAVVIGAANHDISDGETSSDGAANRNNIAFLSDSGVFDGRKVDGGSPLTGIRYSGGKVIDRLLSGTEITARSVLPLRSHAAVKIQWGLRIQSDTTFLGGAGGKQHQMNLPLLVMSKISIEHGTDDSKAKEKKRKTVQDEGPTSSDLAEACFSVRRQLDVLQSENGMLRKAVEDLRSEFSFAGRKTGGLSNGSGTGSQFTAGRGSGPAEVRTKSGEDGRVNGSKGAAAVATGKNGRRSDGKGAATATTKDDVNEELKKALMDASGGRSGA